MTELIRLEPFVWPYSLEQLRLDEPRRSFSPSPSPDELAAYKVYRFDNVVTLVPPPEVDPLTQRLEQRPPIEVDGRLTQQWEVVKLSPEEQATVKQALFPPDWISFAFSLPPETSALLANAFAVDTRLHGTLLVGMGQASTGDSRVFLNAWQIARSIGLIEHDLIATIQAIAKEYHLPEEFIAALGGELPR